MKVDVKLSLMFFCGNRVLKQLTDQVKSGVGCNFPTFVAAPSFRAWIACCRASNITFEFVDERFRREAHGYLCQVYIRGKQNQELACYLDA